MTLWVLIPVKRLPDCKQRLAADVALHILELPGLGLATSTPRLT